MAQIMDRDSVSEEFKKKRFLSMIKSEVLKVDYQEIIKSALIEKLSKFVAGVKSPSFFLTCRKNRY